MASCNPACSINGCGGPVSGELLLKKINMMLSDNYTLLFALLLIFIVLGLSMSYFVNSLRATLKAYYDGKRDADEAAAGGKKGKKSGGDGDPRNPADDSEVYYNDPQKDDPVYTDPAKYMERNKRVFLENVATAYKQYNQEKSKYIAGTYAGRDNDDIIDDDVLYSAYDKYTYPKERA